MFHGFVKLLEAISQLMKIQYVFIYLFIYLAVYFTFYCYYYLL